MVGLGGSCILGIIDFGRFRGRCAGLVPGLVFEEQSEGPEPKTRQREIKNKTDAGALH